MDWAHKAQELLAANESIRKSVGLTQQTDLSPLQIAALYEPQLAETMLTEGVPCDLHTACALGRTDLIRSLYSNAAAAYEVDLLPPIGFALIKGQTEALSILLEAGDDPNRPLQRIGFFVWELEVVQQARWSPIHMAATHGYLENAPKSLEVLIDHGAQIGEVCMLGETPLHLAATYGWLPVMTTLLDLGANVDATTTPVSEKVNEVASPDGAPVDAEITALMVACREGSTEAAKLLLERGASVHATSSRGWRPLHFAAGAWWQENADIVKLLLNAGADPGATDHNVKQAIHYAATKNYDKVTELLNQTVN